MNFNSVPGFTGLFALLFLAEFGVEFRVHGALSSQTPIAVPVDQLPEGRHVFGASHTYIHDFPPWVNLTLLEVGQRYMAKNYFGFLYSLALSTMLVSMNVDALRVAISSGNTIDPKRAMRRYMVITLHFSHWSTANLRDPKELAAVFEQMNLIQAVHAKVGHAAVRHKVIFEKPLIPEPESRVEAPYNIDWKLWEAFEADIRSIPELLLYKQGRTVFPPKNGGTEVYFNQFAMAIQMWGFLYGPLTRPETVNFYNVTDENLWGYNHFMAFMAYAIGMEDKYNVALQPDLATAREYYTQMLREFFIPALYDLDYEYKVGVEVAVKCLTRDFPPFDFSLALHLVCTDIFGVECPRVRAARTAKARFYETLLVTMGRPVLQYDLYQSALKFIVNGMIQLPTIREFGFNPLRRRSEFTQGLLKLDEHILATSTVEYNETTLLAASIRSNLVR